MSVSLSLVVSHAANPKTASAAVNLSVFIIVCLSWLRELPAPNGEQDAGLQREPGVAQICYSEPSGGLTCVHAFQPRKPARADIQRTRADCIGTPGNVVKFSGRIT
ncbi:MAG: hypothetical protein ACRCWR_06210 [Saezia sp.]